ncbi:MAG: hypothetical protein U0M06_04455 [Clostridia bacterium]|nr:hypothetical protein [Clostridia bacterium]
MKKFFATMLACLIIFSIVSCSENRNGKDSSDSGDVTGDATTSPVEEKCDYTFEIIEEISAVHETEDGRKSMKVLRYPKISGMPDKNIEDSVNAILYETAGKKYKEYVPDEDIYVLEDNTFSYEVENVSVTYLSNSFISVKNSVYFMTEMASYPSLPVYTLNIDLETGKEIKSADIFGDFNIITSKFIAGDFNLVYGEANLLESTNYEDMILQYKSDYESYPYVYFENGNLVVCIDLVHALGTSAGFAISANTVAEALKVNPFK